MHAQPAKTTGVDIGKAQLHRSCGAASEPVRTSEISVAPRLFEIAADFGNTEERQGIWFPVRRFGVADESALGTAVVGDVHNKQRPLATT
ncbi:hypothetical protein ABT115_27850 [Streptomyces sp. NPDC001832]|uniref:hypothetical protein n=1 Tax=Streptomyces sp. NPDC001832 TaxID=3154527 RepID=UPI00332FD74C